MSRLSDLNLDPDRRTLRQFGWVALVGFGGIALVAWMGWLPFLEALGAAREEVVGGLLGVGVVTAVLGQVAPDANRPLYVAMSVAAYPVGWAVSQALLALMFFGLFAPVAIVFRWTGRDPLHRRLDRRAASYWHPARRDRPKESYFRQF